MSAYEAHLATLFAGATEQLAPMMEHVLARRGKSIRPLLVMLAAGLFEGSARGAERRLVAATMIEVVHTASLVHDDVIDRAAMRRAAPSVNALWGDHCAVLVGDYLLTRGFASALESGHHDIVIRVNEALARVCEGEMLQSAQSAQLTMTRAIYLDIIERKTALLLATAASLGATAADASTQQVERMYQYGRLLGMAFQIGDDVLDYSASDATGKPALGDIRERKINLPLLMLLDSSPDADRAELLGRLASLEQAPENVDYLYRAVIQSDALEKSAELLREYTAAAARELDDFADSDCKRSLLALCDYVAAREK